MQRMITKDKYHNNREETAKEKKRTQDDIIENTTKLSEQVEYEQAKLEEE